MNVKSIERKGNEATVVVEIDKELMESGVNKAYMKARKSIQIPGFRKGKAPRKVIEMQFGEGVFYEDAMVFVLVSSMLQIISSGSIELASFLMAIDISLLSFC